MRACARARARARAAATRPGAPRAAVDAAGATRTPLFVWRVGPLSSSAAGILASHEAVHEIGFAALAAFVCAVHRRAWGAACGAAAALCEVAAAAGPFAPPPLSLDASHLYVAYAAAGRAAAVARALLFAPDVGLLVQPLFGPRGRATAPPDDTRLGLLRDAVAHLAVAVRAMGALPAAPPPWLAPRDALATSQLCLRYVRVLKYVAVAIAAARRPTASPAEVRAAVTAAGGRLKYLLGRGGAYACAAELALCDDLFGSPHVRAAAADVVRAAATYAGGGAGATADAAAAGAAEREMCEESAEPRGSLEELLCNPAGAPYGLAGL